MGVWGRGFDLNGKYGYGYEYRMFFCFFGQLFTSMHLGVFDFHMISLTNAIL